MCAAGRAPGERERESEGRGVRKREGERKERAERCEGGGRLALGARILSLTLPAWKVPLL